MTSALAPDLAKLVATLPAAARVMIGGIPRAGKTTDAAALAAVMGVKSQPTDDLIGKLDWSAASAEVATWLSARGPWLVEGVTVARALRKWLVANPTGSPCDVLLWNERAHVPLIPGQVAMAKGCQTVFAEIRAELLSRGTRVVHRNEGSDL